MSKDKFKIGIVGTGYVGLVTGACFADKDNNVVCFDILEDRLNALSDGKIPFFEPGLAEKVKHNVSEGRLSFSLINEDVINDFDFLFVCVGTPDDGTGNTDLTQLYSFIEFLNENSKKESILVIRSTVPVGTCEEIQDQINLNNSFKHIVCSNPEFTKEGDAINDFEKPDRIIVGLPDDNYLKKKFISLYEPFTSSKNIIFMSTKSSELTKYASNAFLSTKISFINDMARFADNTGANISDVAHGMGMDPRIGNSFLNAGIGYGGSCFPKDTISLLNQASSRGETLNVLDGVIKTNDLQIQYFHKMIIEYFKTKNIDKKVTIHGLSFKPGTDDVRESRAVLLYKMLKDSGFIIKCFDPMNLNFINEPIPYSKNLNDALSGSNAAIITVEDQIYADYDLNFFKNKGIKAIFDGRNVLSYDEKKSDNLDYFGIGNNIKFTD